MKTLSPDTTPEAQRAMYEMMRRMPAWKRLRLACELTQAGRKLMVADLRHRFPRATDDELRRRFIGLLLTREETMRVYGFDPKREDG